MRIFAFRERLGTFESYHEIFSDTDESHGHLVKCRFWSSSSGARGLRFCISNQFPGAVYGVGPHLNNKSLRKCSKGKGKKTL